jgi:DNA-binding MarR family transcriptional regulator
MHIHTIRMSIQYVKSYDPRVEREDLGALFGRITRRLIAAEQPVLTAQGLSMWGYIVLSQLAKQPAETQLALAQAVGYDKTRLSGLLDDLERDKLISREPDPSARRARIVRLTSFGATRHAAAQAAIRDMEAGLLGDLEGQEQQVLFDTLTRLAE